jgi:TRAP-type C4-dicarboxylate transport system permease small subunit
MNKYDELKISAEEKTGEVFAVIAGIFLIVASVVMFANMVTRTAADYNIRIVYELCQLCGAGVAALAIPYATIKAAHTEMDIITGHLHDKARNLLAGISGILTMVIMVFTNYMLVDYAYMRTLVMETTTTNHLPMWIFRWLYAFGMIVTLIAAAIEMIDSFRLASGKQVFRNREEYDAYLETAKLEGGEKNE